MLRQLILATITAGSLVSGLSCSADSNTINTDDDLTQLASCRTLKGDLILGTGVSSPQIKGIQSIGGSLICEGATNATSITSPDLQEIGKELRLVGLTTLSTLSMPKLHKCNSVMFQTLPAASAMSFAPITEAESVIITDTVFTSLEGINLENCAVFNINNNRYLKTIDSQLQTVSNALSIAFNAKSVKVTFNDLIWSNNCTFRDVGSVMLPKIQTVNGSMGFINNTFESFSAPNLTSVGKDIAFVDDGSLTSIDFPLLTTIGGGLQIANNTALETLNGFPKLTKIQGAGDFNGVFNNASFPQLNDVVGGLNLQTTGNLDCSPYDKLKSGGNIRGTYLCKAKLASDQVGGAGTKPKSNSSSAASGQMVLSYLSLAGSFMFSLVILL